MTELIVEVARDVANRGFGVYGTSNPDLRTIYTGLMPDTCVEGILITEVVSPSPHEYVATEYPILDFWAKSPKSDRARDLLRSVYDTFHRRYGYSYDDWYVYNSRALGAITNADSNNESSKLYRLTVQFRCRNLNTVS